jgi:lipopolysaccharide assembly outer membrane protein LptD (OstA)
MSFILKSIITFVILFTANFLYAQKDSSITIGKKDVNVISDTIKMPAKKGEIASEITYSCTDSIAMDVQNKIVILYGNAQVNYGDLKLTAGRIEINYDKNTVKASPSEDSTKKDYPVFKQGPDQYEARHIEYNLKSKKGLVRDIITQQGDGYIHGDPVKRTEDAVYVNKARYTTCNLGHPHFYLNARKLKVIPDDKVVTGPFNVVVADIPTPIGLPFGFFPITTTSRSGIIFPTIGEQRDRGFFLSQGGFYWAASDHLNVKIIGDVYTNKSYRVAVSSDYKKRYVYEGNSILNYSKMKSGFDDEPFPEDFSFVWNHRTTKKTSGKFSASVNLTSNNYYRLNSYNPVSYQSSVFTSTISYYKSFRNSPFNLGVTMRQNQNVVTKQMDLTAPEVNFSMNRIYPFKKKESSGNLWYEKINISYNMNTKYVISNKFKDSLGQDTIIPFKNEGVTRALNNAQTGMQHVIPISTTFKLLKYFSLNPTFTYEEYWYLSRQNYEYNATKKAVVVKDTIHEFSRAGAYNLNTNLTTRIYGTYKINSGILRGIRHTLVPNLSYTYRPDFSDPQYVSYQSFDQVRDSKGNPTRYSIYNGYVYGGPGQGTVNSVGFALQNNFEAKVRNRKDTTGNASTKKVKLLDNLSFSGNYNFSADSLNLSLLRLDARTKIWAFDIAYSSTYDPYMYTVDSVVKSKVYQRQINVYDVKMRSYSLSVGANFNPKARNNSPSPDLSKVNPEELSMINRYPERYIDFKIPWSLSMTYNINYSKVGYQEKSITQSIMANGNLSLTEKWKLTGSSGYDFVAKGISYTMIGIIRDLHCWQMSLNIVPFGDRQSYFFTFTAKSSLLQDLKLTKRSPAYYGQPF